jgi:hypothetical protein
MHDIQLATSNIDVFRAETAVKHRQQQPLSTSNIDVSMGLDHQVASIGPATRQSIDNQHA